MFSNYLVGRKLGIREIFRMAKYAFVKDFKNYFWVFISLFLPINLMTTIVNYLISSVQSGFDLSVVMESPEKLAAFAQTAEYALMNKYNFVIMIIELLFVPLTVMAVARITKNYAYGRETNFKEVFIETISKGSTLIFATILYIIFILLGVVALVVPGIALAGFFAFYVYNIMLSDSGVFASLKKSFKMVGKKWFSVVIYIIPFYVIKTAVTYGVTIILGMFAVDVFTTTVVLTVASLGDVLYAICMTLLFLNMETGGFYIKPNKEEKAEIEQ